MIIMIRYWFFGAFVIAVARTQGWGVAQKCCGDGNNPLSKRCAG